MSRTPPDLPVVTRIDAGTFRVVVEGRAHLVHVAGGSTDRWAYWNGRVFHRPFAAAAVPRRAAADNAPQTLSAPMPATVRTVLVEAGAAVRKGDTLVVLEAMKMELPIRAGSDATVAAIRCREGDLVQPGAVLVELR